MKGLNQCIFTGNLTQDPQLQYTKINNTPVLNFTIACNELVRSDAGGMREEANFLDFSMFGKHAESIAKLLTKGTQVTIQSHARRSTWQDRKTGEKKTRITFIVEDIFVGRPGKGAQQPQHYPEDIDYDDIDDEDFDDDDYE